MQEPICILHGYVLACTLHQNQRWRRSSAFYSKNFGSVDPGASEFFCEQEPQALIVERKLPHKLLQLSVLLLQPLQPLCVGHVHPAELGFPPVEGLLANSELSADLGCCPAGLVLFQGQDDLLLGVSALSQGALQRGRTHIILGLVFRGDVKYGVYS